jgi:hypothetical protein
MVKVSSTCSVLLWSRAIPNFFFLSYITACVCVVEYKPITSIDMMRRDDRETPPAPATDIPVACPTTRCLRKTSFKHFKAIILINLYTIAGRQCSCIVHPYFLTRLFLHLPLLFLPFIPSYPFSFLPFVCSFFFVFLSHIHPCLCWHFQPQWLSQCFHRAQSMSTRSAAPEHKQLTLSMAGFVESSTIEGLGFSTIPPL